MPYIALYSPSKGPIDGREQFVRLLDGQVQSICPQRPLNHQSPRPEYPFEVVYVVPGCFGTGQKVRNCFIGVYTICRPTIGRCVQRFVFVVVIVVAVYVTVIARVVVF